MKKIILALFTMLFIGTAAFAQSDLQVLAVVKYNKSESITVKQLKKRVHSFEVQQRRQITLDERKNILDLMIREKLLLQAAEKSGIAITDTMANAAFENELSRQVGFAINEAGFEEIVRNQPGNPTVDEFFMQSIGLSKNEYKEFIRNQAIIQNFILNEKKNEFTQIKPTDEQIRMVYEANKANFVWSDMADILLVSVPKGDNDGAAKSKLNDYKKQLSDKKITVEKLVLQAQPENSGYQAGKILVLKNETYAKALGMDMKSFLALFARDKGFISDIIETENDYRFYSIAEKYDAKMLGISDIVQPGSTYTVYELIRGQLTNQMQMQFLNAATEQIAADLNTPENVEMKKTGEALDKLLSWGE